MPKSRFFQQLSIPQNSKSEKIGSGLFLVLAFGATLACGITGFDVPFLDSLGFLGGLGSQIAAYSIFGINNANWMSGFGLRCGSQGNDRRPQNEKKALLFGGVLGATVGITLFLKAPALLTSLGSYGVVSTTLIAGAASVAGTGGIVLGAVVAAIVMASVCKSCAESVTKAYNYAQYKWGNADPSLYEHIKQHKKEYKGAFYGVIGGVIVGLVATALLLPVLPMIGIAAGVAAGALIVVTAIAAAGGLVSKTFKYFDQCSADRKVSQATSPSKSYPSLKSELENISLRAKPTASTLWQKFINSLPSWMRSSTEKTEAIPEPIKDDDENVPQTVNSFAKVLRNLLPAPSPKPCVTDPNLEISSVELTVPLKSKNATQHQRYRTEKLPPSRFCLEAINGHAIVCAGSRNIKKMQQIEIRAQKTFNTSLIPCKITQQIN